jgi:ribonuclease HIII
MFFFQIDNLCYTLFTLLIFLTKSIKKIRDILILRQITRINMSNFPHSVLLQFFNEYNSQIKNRRNISNFSKQYLHSRTIIQIHESKTVK